MSHFRVVINCGACESFVGRCIASLRSQSFQDWQAYVTVDPCGDATYDAAVEAAGPDQRIAVSANATRRYALQNLIDAIDRARCDSEDVIVILDGDDWFFTDDALQVVADTYARYGCWMTYGSWISNIEGNEHNPDGKWPAYPSNTIDFRNTRWLATHVRTWKKWLWDRIPDHELRDRSGQYFRTTTDQAVMLPLLEMSGATRAQHIPWPLLMFNRLNRKPMQKEILAEAWSNQRWLRSRPPLARIAQHPANGHRETALIQEPPRPNEPDQELPEGLAAVVQSEYRGAPGILELFRRFLAFRDYDRKFSVELLSISRGRTAAEWTVRRTAVLMLEHQIFQLHESEESEYLFVFDLLEVGNPGSKWRAKLGRLERVHRGIAGMGTPPEALHDFIRASMKECKLALARFAFHPTEVVARIRREIRVSEGMPEGLNDENTWVEAASERILLDPLSYEREILELLCAKADIYWVSESTSSELNSLVEYPHTSAALTIKPPGSDREFQIKRAGVRGPHALTIIYWRDGKPVPHTHRLSGGNQKSLCASEAESATRIGRVWNAVHSSDPPFSRTLTLSTVLSAPARNGNASILDYFTEPSVFGPGHREMRAAMRDVVKAYEGNEPSEFAQALPGELGLTLRMIQNAAPTQAILSGTTSYRLDLIDRYLSPEGPDFYFMQGVGKDYSVQDLRGFANEVMDEVLGVYTSPCAELLSWETYLQLAFSLNRERADTVYLSLLEQAGQLWGTLMGAGGFSDGESFVARNMGIKTRWIGDEWTVRLISMDHDNLSLPWSRTREFHPKRALSGMERDERYLLGDPGEGRGKSSLACLKSIYRVDPAIGEEGEIRFRYALEDAYRKTLAATADSPRMRECISGSIIQNLWDWNRLVGNCLARSTNPGDEERTWLLGKGYTSQLADEFMNAAGVREEFLRRNSSLFDLKYLDFIAS